MSSLNLGEIESAESPNKETSSAIAGLGNILFATNFQTKVCYWQVTFIPSSSHFSKLLSRVDQQPNPRWIDTSCPVLFEGFTSFDLSGEAGWLQSTCFSLQQQKLVSTLLSTVMVKGKVEANLALSIVETPAKGEVPHGGGGKGCTNQSQILDGSGSSAISTVSTTAVETAKVMLPERWGSAQTLVTNLVGIL